MEIEKFLPQMITLTKGFVVSGAEFSPDSLHVAVQLLAPEEKKQAVVITNNKLGDFQSLPSGFQFLRWLANDKVLLKGSGGLTIHGISGNEDKTVDTPEGWSGTLIPGTDTGKFSFPVKERWQPKEVLNLLKKCCLDPT